MKPVRVPVHPMFVVLFFVSLVCLGGAFIWSGSTYNRCPTPGEQQEEITARCTLQAQTLQHHASIVALTGVALMIGGVGFQVGRSVAPAPAALPGPFVQGPPAGYSGAYPGASPSAPEPPRPPHS
ncbi:hypothetical protein ACFOVU_00675 [Nocardiopsis sediminis]|uniref:Uncharacterized protein n=1 Tax=Nocardiopsis sediminis TaxID=1778267 RepID=A0ABV8FIB8_9ACTN